MPEIASIPEAPADLAGVHTDKAHYYVSAIDGGRHWLIAGPYALHVAALAQVHPASVEAEKGNPRAYFMAWGTCGSDELLATPLGPEWSPETNRHLSRVPRTGPKRIRS